MRAIAPQTLDRRYGYVTSGRNKTLGGRSLGPKCRPLRSTTFQILRRGFGTRLTYVFRFSARSFVIQREKRFAGENSFQRFYKLAGSLRFYYKPLSPRFLDEFD